MRRVNCQLVDMLSFLACFPPDQIKSQITVAYQTGLITISETVYAAKKLGIDLTETKDA